MNYDLETRTIRFSEEVINFIRDIKRDAINDSILRQLVKFATSVGANYCEANNASSEKDFKNKIYICKKEINETKYWLKLLMNTGFGLKDLAEVLWKEAHELNLIFQRIIKSLNKK